MTTITAKVLSVQKGSKPFNSNGKDYIGYKINVEDKDGQKLTLERNGMADGDFTLATGTQIQVEFDSKTLNSPKGSFVSNKIKKLNIIQDGQLLEVDARGNPKAAFVKGPNAFAVKASVAQFIPAEAPLTDSKTTANAAQASAVSYTPAPVKNTSYSSEGARNGMITGKAVDLAIARGTLDPEGLSQAADDVKALTLHVETGKALSPSPKAQIASKTVSAPKAIKKPVVVDTLEDEDESPFSL